MGSGSSCSAGVGTAGVWKCGKNKKGLVGEQKLLPLLGCTLDIFSMGRKHETLMFFFAYFPWCDRQPLLPSTLGGQIAGFNWLGKQASASPAQPGPSLAQARFLGTWKYGDLEI